MKHETFEANCKTCGRKNEVTVKIPDDGWSHWEEIHCAYCGLLIDEVRASGMPKTRIIEDEKSE